jgi:hypothetical protein
MSEWQMIETAPRDGMEVLVYRRTFLAQPIGVDKINKYGKWVYSADQYPPTHWMRLPSRIIYLTDEG